ncbi:interferon-induced very large GTPase 1 isoform X1 [Amia ocellicauda]|uniref:interferon-induced very large GTPase 1 isoform X1 n=1 Tax=Amia ocellicauda TaxID=2972642 RepID=UPI003463AE6E
MDAVPHSFIVSHCSPDNQKRKTRTDDTHSVISNLQPGSVYTFTVSTALDNGQLSAPVSTTTCTNLAPPEEIKINSTGVDRVSLSWRCPDGMTRPQKRFKITYINSVDRTKASVKIKDTDCAVIDKLRPGRQYTFSVATVGSNGKLSKAASISAYTELSPPGKIKTENITSKSVTLSWAKPADMEGIPFKFKVTYATSGEELQVINTESSTATIFNLEKGTGYTFSVSTVLENNHQSQAVSISVKTKTCLEDLLHDLGLEHQLKNKLTLSTVLQIDDTSITDEPTDSLKSLPWCFLKKLIMANVTARNTKCATSNPDETPQDIDSVLAHLSADLYSSDVINPLDIITALFLCSDSFLQQEMVLKMSMCQFSVPLLLPNCDKQQCTLMLWAMRDIVKKFRPHSLADTRGFVEDNIVLTDLPIMSFVRLGNCSLSKSQILNNIFSNPQQYHDTFVHHDMECGDCPRRISDGLVEISWYFPGGNRNIDIFTEPVALANLRGDISSFETQYSFLCQTSTAVFIFFYDLEHSYKLLTPQQMKAELFLVGNSQCKTFSAESLKKIASELKLKPSNIIIKRKQMNDAEFVKKLRSTVNDVLQRSPSKVKVESMSEVAHELGIPVDEDCPECQEAKQKADAITSNISDIPKYKNRQLPLQGKVWKELAKLEKEECRLKKAGYQNIEEYKCELRNKKQQLRKQQANYDMTEAMTCFIAGISSSITERTYFLKWMRNNLDALSRKNLSGLREKYREVCQNSSENKDLIADLDKQISNSSLGVEHFLREMGQLYEAASSLPSNDPYQQQMQHLPTLCAKLLLDGFPLELVDGDASNIPIKWVSDVLTALHHEVQSNSRLLVVTVLGVQSTGKSTLLNTMFGVQFAVSSGRCTRGAFMLLIKVKDNFKKKLKCDFVMVIDTEGLKSPELAQLADSYEHDNELATLVVGLSDITIINIAMENSTEMKDILQIVVHAFLRMKEVGKKPKCQFVHQNVADVSAHDKNMRDRKLLLEQLNEMTQAAARMEKKGSNRKFTDVMEYNPERDNWYIPGLWHGNPPMAPVNAGYSESVSEFKRNMIEVFKECKNKAHTNQITEFLEWTRSLWKAVKYENFIFSFRNSLVADAYSKLCTEFNKWEWSFRKHMYTWGSNAETKISNFGTISLQSQPSNIDDFMDILKCDAAILLKKGEKEILDNLAEYYERQEGHVYLVEKYREDFVNSAKSLCREIESSLKNTLEAAFEIQKGMKKLDDIKKNHAAVMEQKVLELLERCRKIKADFSEEVLDKEFQNMWIKTVDELSFKGLQRRDVPQDAFIQLRFNLVRQGGSVLEMLNEVKHLDQCGREPFVVKDTKHKNFFKKLYHTLFKEEQTMKTQQMSDSITEQCRQFILDKVRTGIDYHNTYIRELLNMIDERLESNKELETSDRFEACLKLHICGIAARAFQQMHDRFIKVNDPRLCLEQYKEQYCADFKDLFHERDQCQKKAEEFTQLCLRPAVRAYVTKCLGPDIVDEMLTGKSSVDYSTRSFFQFSILKQLLSEEKFENYVKYIQSYEDFVKKWIFGKITEHFSTENQIVELEEKQLKQIIQKIKGAIADAQKRQSEGSHCKDSRNIKEFIQDICSNLAEKLVIPRDGLEAVMMLNNANTEDFSQCLKHVVGEMEQGISAEFHKESDIEKKLHNLPFKPENELFKRVFGCGKQCPFCKAPCEAGGKDHKDHWTSVHRPQGLGGYRSVTTYKLACEICSSDVYSERKFKNSLTDWKLHPYKDYRTLYPDWNIPPDTSIQTTDYWKYVFRSFNQKFAKTYNAKPADMPPDWCEITKGQAMNSLKESFNMK